MAPTWAVPGLFYIADIFIVTRYSTISMFPFLEVLRYANRQSKQAIRTRMVILIGYYSVLKPMALTTRLSTNQIIRVCFLTGCI